MSVWAFLHCTLFGSPEHKVLMVSYCGQSMSIVRHSSCSVNNSCKSLLLLPLGQLTRYLVGSIGVTCRSKIAKIVPIRNPRYGDHLENLFFASSPEPKDQLTSNLLGSIAVTCRSKLAKIMPIGNPRWPPWRPS